MLEIDSGSRVGPIYSCKIPPNCPSVYGVAVGHSRISSLYSAANGSFGVRPNMAANSAFCRLQRCHKAEPSIIKPGPLERFLCPAAAVQQSRFPPFFTCFLSLSLLYEPLGEPRYVPLPDLHVTCSLLGLVSSKTGTGSLEM